MTPAISYLGFNMDDPVVGALAGARGRYLRQAMSLGEEVLLGGSPDHLVALVEVVEAPRLDARAVQLLDAGTPLLERERQPPAEAVLAQELALHLNRKQHGEAAADSPLCCRSELAGVRAGADTG